MSAWSDFYTVIGIQLLFLVVVAIAQRKKRTITPRLVLKSALVGIVLGTIFDVVAGQYLGVFDYVLIVDYSFLLINGALSYGLWFLTIQLFKSERIIPFYMWTVSTGLVYELANYLYPVWYWTFPGSYLLRELVSIFVLYPALAAFVVYLSAMYKKRVQTLRRKNG